MTDDGVDKDASKIYMNTLDWKGKRHNSLPFKMWKVNSSDAAEARLEIHPALLPLPPSVQ
jgi:hypothetical protein